MKTELYNCHRIDERHYRMTKFDEDLNPMHSAQKNAEPRVCSYICTTDTCDCPAGEAKSCRHRKMLNIFISNKKVDTEYFFNYEQHSWYVPPGNNFDYDNFIEIPPVTDEGPLMEKVLLEAKNITATEVEERIKATKPPSPDFTEPLDELLHTLEGGVKAPASEAPSPRPSTAYRRF